jgi:hypothetical protein
MHQILHKLEARPEISSASLADENKNQFQKLWYSVLFMNYYDSNDWLMHLEIVIRLEYSVVIAFPISVHMKGIYGKERQQKFKNRRLRDIQFRKDLIDFNKMCSDRTVIFHTCHH